MTDSLSQKRIKLSELELRLFDENSIKGII